jgi:hypothetical protein
LGEADAEIHRGQRTGVITHEPSVALIREIPNSEYQGLEPRHELESLLAPRQRGKVRVGRRAPRHDSHGSRGFRLRGEAARFIGDHGFPAPAQRHAQRAEQPRRLGDQLAYVPSHDGAASARPLQTIRFVIAAVQPDQPK